MIILTFAKARKPVENSVETVENIEERSFFHKKKRMFLWKTIFRYNKFLIFLILQNPAAFVGLCNFLT